MKSNIGILLLFLICWKTENVHTDKVIVGDFEIQEPLGDELIEDFDENDFLIRELDEFVEASLRDLNYTQLCNSTQNNTTGNSGVLAAFTSSITVILVSEIGDKTFFIAAILAMRNNKLVVFIAALAALYLMTILSALLGWVVTTFIPREITYYTCTAIMFLFGLKMLWEAWRMKSDETEETQREVEQELGVMEGQAVSTEDSAERGEINPGFTPDQESKDPGVKDKVVDFMHKYVLAKSNSKTPEIATNDQTENKSVTQSGDKTSSKKKTTFIDRIIDDKCADSACFSAGCLRIFKLFINCFSMTFIAEWGDRSQLATIVLAGINNVWGVIIGGCLGHTVCTGAAVLVGMIVAKFISARVITFIGALVFIGFAIASLFTDPNQDGIDGIPDIPGYDNCTRLINHNIKLTLKLEETDIYG